MSILNQEEQGEQFTCDICIHIKKMDVVRKLLKRRKYQKNCKLQIIAGREI